MRKIKHSPNATCFDDLAEKENWMLIKKAIQNEIGNEYKVYATGSRTVGCWRNDSDYDIAIVPKLPVKIIPFTHKIRLITGLRVDICNSPVNRIEI